MARERKSPVDKKKTVTKLNIETLPKLGTLTKLEKRHLQRYS